MSILYQEGFDPALIARQEAIFHTANGYVGVRASLEEGVPEGVKSIRGTYLNGFYNLRPIAYGEKLYGFPDEQEVMPGVADAQTIRLNVGDELFSPFTGTLEHYSRTLDMDAGVSTRNITWRTEKGATVKLTIDRLASWAEPALFLIRYRVESVDYEGALTFESTLSGEVRAYADPTDPRVAPLAVRHLAVEKAERREGVEVLTLKTLNAQQRMACAVGHRLNGRPAGRLSAQVRPGEAIVLEKWCAFRDSRRAADPAQAAFDILERAMAEPIDAWFARQRAAVSAFWDRARVEIRGDEALQSAIDFSLYQLMQSAGRDALSSVAAKGLSGEGYEGHYFWDTEIYIFPFFLLTDAARARELLRFRHGILPGAKAHARVMGHARGALYPWRTIAGRECSSYYPTGSAQYHINADVAGAVLQYWHLSGDIRFMAECGAEVLVETALLWLDVGHMNGDKFEIHSVTGPDEYTLLVDNNYYTNVGARANLIGAVRVMRALTEAGLADGVIAKTGVTPAELDAFEDAARRMLLPYDEERGIYAQDDSFLRKKVLPIADIPRDQFPLLLNRHPLFLSRHQVLKQADAVLAHFLHEEGVDEGAMRRTYDYYEPLTTHDSSLSPCIHGIMAARLGDMDKAMAYFRETARLDLDDTHLNTADGLHTANLGGVYLSVVMGFAGLRIGEEGVSLCPQLPGDLEGYAFSFLVGGSRVRCEVGREDCQLTRLEGPPARLRVYGEGVLVTGTYRFPVRSK